MSIADKAKDQSTDVGSELLQRIQQDAVDTQAGAASILLSAGANKDAIGIVQANPGLAAMIVSNPELAKYWAKKYPSVGTNAYQAAEATYFGGREAQQHMGFGGADALIGLQDSQKTGTDVLYDIEGAKKLANGVIILPPDPQTGEPQVLMPSDPEGKLKGSWTWLQKASQNWSKEKIASWRKDLAARGYTVQETGGWADDLRKALQEYHQRRYAGIADPYPEGETQTKVKDVASRAELHQAIGDEFTALGLTATAKDKKDWADWIRSQIKSRLEEGEDPSRALAKTEAKFENKFEATPEAQFATDVNANVQENTTLLNRLTSLASLAGGR